MTEEAALTETCSIPVGKGNRRALPGYAWECTACGKTSRDLYGQERISRLWDESCTLNARLVKVPS